MAAADRRKGSTMKGTLKLYKKKENNLAVQEGSFVWGWIPGEIIRSREEDKLRDRAERSLE